MAGDIDTLLPKLRSLQLEIARRITESCETQASEDLAAIAEETEGDTIYRIDRIGEAALVDYVEREIAPTIPVVLVAEGLDPRGLVLPRGSDESAARWRIIVDPIDGTRGLMYQKRSAWVLTAAAPNRGSETSLRDLAFALQTEIPLVKQHLFDSVWAVRGRGATAERTDRFTGARSPLTLAPSRASGIDHGFASIARFIPGARAELAGIDDDVAAAVLGRGTLPDGGDATQRGRETERRSFSFEDQYLSTGGQIFELMSGRDRFVADLRPLVRELARAQGLDFGITCHPYDICTHLIAEELGVIVADPNGETLDAPLDLVSAVSWVGYANSEIRALVEPRLQRALRDRGLL